MAKRVFLVNVIQLGDCLNWAKILEITEVERIFGVPFSLQKICINFDICKMCWAKIWAIFSQTDLVALVMTIFCMTRQCFKSKTPFVSEKIFYKS
jgi:hypothetical protein